MFKKTALAAIVAIMAFTVQAQTWKIHSQFVGTDVKNIIDAGDNVYSLVGNSLYRYNKLSEQVQGLSKADGLSDILVKSIYFNPSKDYLVAVYDNSNLDVITSDGRVVNIPAIKDAVINGSKIINDITFGNDNHMYLATDFGYVAINDQNMTVDVFKNFRTPMRSVLKVGEALLACQDNNLLYNANGQTENLSAFTSLGQLTNRNTKVNDNKIAVTLTDAHLYAISDSSFFLTTVAANDSSYLKRVTLTTTDEGTSAVVLQLQRLGVTTPYLNIQKTPTGFIANCNISNRVYYSLPADGASVRSLNAVANGLVSAYPGGDGTFWGVGASGLFKNVTPVAYVMPQAVNLRLPYWVAVSPGNGDFVVSNPAPCIQIPSPPTTGVIFSANRYDGESWNTNAAIWPSPTNSITPVPNTSGYRPAFDPNEPNTYYVPTWYSGVLKVRNDSVVGSFTYLNSPMTGKVSSTGTVSAPYYCCCRCDFDCNGNLWVVRTQDGTSYGQTNIAMMLPKDKLHADDFNSITKEDWMSYYIPGAELQAGSKWNTFGVTKDNVCALAIGAYKTPVFFWRGDNITTPLEVKSTSEFIDQDGNVFSLNSEYWHPYFSTDSTNHVWMSINNELYYIETSTIFDHDIVPVVRPRVAGGDYLISADIAMITVDALNRKWVATNDDGLYVINAEGNEVIWHFDTSNSPMQSNTVYNANYSPVTNSALIVTANGIIECLFDDPEQTLSDIEAYPNPVLPTFTGYVTIAGVIKGSQVRITDRQGNTVTEFTATDKALWDTCGADHQRVPTGVYSIYVAAPGEAYPEQPQATLRIVK